MSSGGTRKDDCLVGMAQGVSARSKQRRWQRQREQAEDRIRLHGNLSTNSVDPCEVLFAEGLHQIGTAHRRTNALPVGLISIVIFRCRQVYPVCPLPERIVVWREANY